MLSRPNSIRDLGVTWDNKLFFINILTILFRSLWSIRVFWPLYNLIFVCFTSTSAVRKLFSALIVEQVKENISRYIFILKILFANKWSNCHIYLVSNLAALRKVNSIIKFFKAQRWRLINKIKTLSIFILYRI